MNERIANDNNPLDEQALRADLDKVMKERLPLFFAEEDEPSLTQAINRLRARVPSEQTSLEIVSSAAKDTRELTNENNDELTLVHFLDELSAVVKEYVGNDLKLRWAVNKVLNEWIKNFDARATLYLNSMEKPDKSTWFDESVPLILKIEK